MSILLVAAMVIITGCSSIEEGQAPIASRAAIPMDVPPIMRGTVASEAILMGFKDVVVSGYGLVVGLNGTGDRLLPPNLRSHMLMEMGRHGIGSQRFGYDITPERMLSSPQTAVVVVKGVVPPGAPEGTIFDVRVAKAVGSDATSLEGGILYTCDLRPDMVSRGATPQLGRRQGAIIAKAKGRIFTNPFASPDNASSTVVNPTVGRILGGGATLRQMPLKLKLATPSHTTAAKLVQAINLHFPQEPGQPSPTARGESGESIEITVPPSFHDHPRDFAFLLQYTTTATASVERWIQTINRQVVDNSEDAQRAAWRWEAMGRRALPAIKKFYDYPDEAPRYAALRAGARLDDPLVAPHLIDLAKNGSNLVRVEALSLLGDMPANPTIDQGLAELLNDPDTQIRLSAYEALVKRRNVFHIDRTIVDDEFIVDFVRSERPLIYITQSDEPRIVVFGEGVEIDRPVTISAWSDRFLMLGDLDREKLRIRYRNLRTGIVVQEQVRPSLRHFIRFLGHTKTIESPSPGLGLTYSETVSMLYTIREEGYLPAPLVAEQDRILALIYATQDGADLSERPEFTDSSFDYLKPGDAETGGLAPDSLAPLGADELRELLDSPSRVGDTSGR